MATITCPGTTGSEFDEGHPVHAVPEAEFYVAKGKRDRVCKACRRLIQRRYERRHEDRVRTNKREWQRRKTLRIYGLTVEQFDALVLEQEGRCAVCQQPRELQVDHCHDSGRVRGLLCGQCNKAEGLLGSLENARRLVTYLEAA